VIFEPLCTVRVFPYSSSIIGQMSTRREIQNPQMFETDPESFSPAIYFSTVAKNNKLLICLFVDMCYHEDQIEGAEFGAEMSLERQSKCALWGSPLKAKETKKCHHRQLME
jgi:hypothetical protein